MAVASHPIGAYARPLRTGSHVRHNDANTSGRRRNKKLDFLVLAFVYVSHRFTRNLSCTCAYGYVARASHAFFIARVIHSHFCAQSKGVARMKYRIPHCMFSMNLRTGLGSFCSIRWAMTPANLSQTRYLLSHSTTAAK